MTEYVSLRLQQLVPETCEHPEREVDAIVAEGPVLPGTRIRCTDEVLHRLGRIPIPFVRQMVAEKVAETARAEKVGLGRRALLRAGGHLPDSASCRGGSPDV